MRNIAIARDAVAHNMQLGASTDIPIARIQQMLKMWSTKTHGLVMPLEVLNRGWDAALWDYLHDGFKLFGYEHLVSKLDPESKTYEQEKNEIGTLMNDVFGGQNLDNLMVNPRTIKWLMRGFLSPDWQISTIRQALSVTGFGAAHKETIALRRKVGRHFWYRAAAYFWVGMNLLNMSFRKKDEEEYPQYYKGKLIGEMHWWDYTMYGNARGSKTKLFIGRNKDKTESYLRWGKQFKELPELVLDETGFNPWQIWKKISGKFNPLLQLAAYTTGHTWGGYKIWSMRDQEGWDRVGAFVKEILKAPLPFSLKSLAEEEREFRLTDLFMPRSKGMTRYKAKRLLRLAMLRGDENLYREVFSDIWQNKMDAGKLADSVIGGIRTDYKREVGAYDDEIEELKESLKKAKTKKIRTDLKDRLRKIKVNARDAQKSIKDIDDKWVKYIKLTKEYGFYEYEERELSPEEQELQDKLNAEAKRRAEFIPKRRSIGVKK
jgi:hypothetical protein